jgi:hypothetical protein
MVEMESSLARKAAFAQATMTMKNEMQAFACRINGLPQTPRLFARPPPFFQMSHTLKDGRFPESSGFGTPALSGCWQMESQTRCEESISLLAEYFRDFLRFPA